MVGGVDYLCATGYDEALRIPSLDSAALAVRTMQVVAYEHGAGATLDPFAGSTKLRDVDDHVQTEVRRELSALFDIGGPLEAIHNGYIAGRIDENRGARQDQISRRERLMVGHTVFRAGGWADLFSGKSSGEIDFGAVERDAVDRIRAHKASRDPVPVQRCLDEVQAAASGKDNLLPPTIAALRVGATSPEIVAATKEGFDR
jgi:methylmalonyl-CoA mutase N-terminal domain/subunit